MKFLIYSSLIFFLYSCSGKGNNNSDATKAEVIKVQPVGTLSSESIYQLTDTFTTQDNKSITLSTFSGKPTVVAMVFTHCPYACPRITSDMVDLEKKLKEFDGKINFLLVSFDSERDVPDTLKKFAENMSLDKNWTLLHGNDDLVRTLSVLLNIQYAKDVEGNFSHSNIISVLNKQGVLKYQNEGLNVSQDETLANIKKLL